MPPATLMVAQPSDDPLTQCLALDAYLLLMTALLLPLFLLGLLERRAQRLQLLAARRAAGQPAAPDGHEAERQPALLRPHPPEASCTWLWGLYMQSCFAWYVVNGAHAARDLL